MMELHSRWKYVWLYCTVLFIITPASATKYGHAQSDQYVQDFPTLMEKSYTMVDTDGPAALLTQCKNPPKQNPTGDVIVFSESVNISSSEVQSQCGTSTTCILQGGLTLEMDAPLKVHSLIVKDGGKVLWTDTSHPENQRSIWLCAGYIAIESGGSFELNLQDEEKRAWVYIMNNGAFHPTLKSRSFGAVGNEGEDNMMINIQGRDLKRTWSLLQQPLLPGSRKMKLLHQPLEMGWKIGDRISIAPTDARASGEGQSFVITSMKNDGTIVLNDASNYYYDANSYLSPNGGEAILQSAEVINLSRNIVISGDDFEEIPCDSSLSEAFPGEQTSLEGCRCATIRNSCTVGLHTIHMFGGSSRIENTRVEKCGQRGIEGKYCLHFHQLKECPNCIFRNNAIETSQQRGLIIHGTHLSTSETNVFYNVRGANIYIEDGNELGNTVSYNVAICPWRYDEGGCSVPGTSNSQGDTSINQAGIYAVTPTNNLIGNRMANHFNGMFIETNGIGRGPAYGKVCTRYTPVGRIEGNVFHSNGRFGTYFLSNNYPLLGTGQSVSSNGYTVSCTAFTPSGQDNGYSTALRNNFDYGNAFVGNYNAGDIQFSHHTSIDNNNLIYWKETKVFADGCSAHIRDSFFRGGTMGLPDSLGSFIIENTVIQDAIMEANHHCTVGTTGFLCMPHYILHNVTFSDNAGKWVTFNRENNQNNGGIFSLSPEDAELNNRNSERFFFLPAGYTALVSRRFSYLLTTGKCDASANLGLGNRYENGILCKSPLQVLKIFTKGLSSRPRLKVEISLTSSGTSISSFSVPHHQTSNRKQGYVLAIIPGSDFRYKLRLDSGQGDIPDDWIIDFGDVAQSNRWGVEEAQLEIQGRNCGSVVRSNHDRRFVAANSEDLLNEYSWGHGACTSYPPMPMNNCFVDSEKDKLQPLECPELCESNDCGENGYCDCYLQQCVCKPGYSGSGCEFDSCASSQCVHGTCAAKFLGPSTILPDTPCVCKDGWVGNNCDINLCESVDCGDHGVCKALSETEAICNCEAGWTGSLCDETCNGFCIGSYPYGCATNIEGKVNYICGPSINQCYYSTTIDDTGPSSWCTFKSTVPTALPPNLPPIASPTQPTLSPISQPTMSPVTQPTGPCESVDCGNHGVCKVLSETEAICDCEAGWSGAFCDDPCDGFCVGSYPYNCSENLPGKVNYICGPSVNQCYYSTTVDDTGPPGWCTFKSTVLTTLPPNLSPTESPTISTIQPTLSPVTQPTNPCESIDCGDHGVCKALSETEAICEPISQPTLPPVTQPTNSPKNPTYCGCGECTTEIWNTYAGDYTCGARIEWLHATYPNEYPSKKAACRIVSSSEFSTICGPYCNPDLCDQTIVPTKSPINPITITPSKSPTKSPTKFPTKIPTQIPTVSPTKSPTSIPTKVPSSSPTRTPTKKPTRAPTKVPTIPPTRSPTRKPTRVPTKVPTLLPTQAPTKNPTRAPTKASTVSPTYMPTMSSTDSPQASHCSCSKCTDDIWDADADGSRCGNRIMWLQQTYPDIYTTEEAACQLVAEEYPLICGACNPRKCVQQRCGCITCTDENWSMIANGSSCGSRIEWLQVKYPIQYPTEEDACQKVAEEYPTICGPKCDPSQCNEGIRML